MEHEFIWLNAQKCVLPVFFPVDFYYSSNKSTGKETGKSHLCETGCPVISVCLLVSVDTTIYLSDECSHNQVAISINSLARETCPVTLLTNNTVTTGQAFGQMGSQSVRDDNH